MDRNEIMATFEMLAKGQGFYGGVLEAINQATDEEREQLFTTLENANLHDAVDLVTYMEG